MSSTVETDTLTEMCLTVGRALTLAVPDSGMAEGCSTSSTLSAHKWEIIRFLSRVLTSKAALRVTFVMEPPEAPLCDDTVWRS